MKKTLFILFITSLIACKGQNSPKEYKGIDKATFDKLYENTKAKTPNYTIIYGLVLGVSEPEFDLMLSEKVKSGTIKAVEMNSYPPVIEFDLLNNEKINMKVSCSASGLFANYPVISFKTNEINDAKELLKTRNKFIEWAISKYGDQYHVSNMTDFEGSGSKKNFRWVADTYSIDITDVSNRVSLSYRKLE